MTTKSVYARLRGAVMVLLFSTCPALAGNGGDALEELRQQLAPMENLSARFRQTLSSEDGHLIQETGGRLVVARPGKVYWESEEPYEQYVISDAETLWLYDPDLEQVTVRPFERDISRTPAILFIGEVKDLERRYRVAVDRDGEGTRFELIPRDDDSLYEKLTITFQDDRPVAMALWDSLGQVTEVVLDEVNINAAIDDAIFEFQPPPGVDVLHDD